MASAASKTALKTLRIQPGPSGRFEVRDGNRVLGTSQNEIMAIWTAVGVAEEITKSGRIVRVVVQREGVEVEEFLARPAETFLF